MNGEPLIEGQKFDASASFARMTDLVRHNAANSFGGACVIVPPAGAGDAIEVLLLDPKLDPVLFWSTLKSKIELVLAELDEKRRQQAAFGVMR